MSKKEDPTSYLLGGASSTSQPLGEAGIEQGHLSNDSINSNAVGDNHGLGDHNSDMGIEEGLLGLEEGSLQLEEGSLGLEEGSLGLEEGSLGLDDSQEHSDLVSEDVSTHFLPAVSPTK